MRVGQGAVAAPQSAATDAGEAAYRAGGNAIDAALAAALSLTVVYPNNSTLGGDLVALVHRAGSATVEINASGPAALRCDVEEVRRRHTAMPVYGPATVTVPGLVAGLHRLWRHGAVLPWAAAFGPAVEHAEQGFALPPSLADALAREAVRLRADPGLRELLFRADGTPMAAGERLVQPALARTLRTLASEGPEAFYRGPIAVSMLRWLGAWGSPLEAGDLERFSPAVGAPLAFAVAGEQLLTSQPNTQGFLLPLILGAAAELDGHLDSLGSDAGSLARVFAQAIADRERHLGDPRFGAVPVELLLERSRLVALARSAAAGGGLPGSAHRAPPRASGDTVAVVTADGEGNAVCLIQSVFHAFGAGVIDPESGVIFHNRGSLFSLEPESPNVLAPGKRPAHTLMPTMLLRDGRPSAVLGTMGGTAQPQILAHVLLHRARGLTPQAALEAPRWTMGRSGADEAPEVLMIEGRVGSAARSSLAEVGLPVHALADYDEEAGHAQLVTTDRAGHLEAASDPRSEGAARVLR